MKNKKVSEKENCHQSQLVKIMSISLMLGLVAMITGCVTAVPVAYTTPAAGVHHYPTTAHTSHVVHRNHVVHPGPVAVRPVAPVARAASPVGVHGTARRTSRRVTRRR